MEYDCRLMSGHWGKFLAAALQQAIRAEGSEGDRTAGISSNQLISTVLPQSPEGLPDLLAFDRIWESDKWLDSQVMFNEKKLEEMKAMIYGEQPSLSLCGQSPTHWGILSVSCKKGSARACVSILKDMYLCVVNVLCAMICRRLSADVRQDA